MKQGLSALLFALVAAPFAHSQAELWDQAIALYTKSAEFVPATITFVMEELNGDGSTKSVVETVSALSYGPDGKAGDSVLISAVRDGKDVTDEMRKSMSNRDNKGGGNGAFGFNGMLFDAESRKKTQLLPGATWLVRDGRKIGVIPFEMNMDGKGNLKGEAEIDAATGIPLIVRSSASFPFVKQLRFDLEYAPLPSGSFALSKMDFEGTVKFLLVNKPFRGSIELSGYKKLEG